MVVLICILPVFDIYDNIHISKNHSLKLLLMYKEFDVVLVKTCDFFLHKFLRGKWKRSSNQRMRTWYHYRHYGYLLEKYRNSHIPEGKNDGPIWMFWWQRIESMPPIVRKCYELAVLHAPINNPVILLTAANYNDYAAIPEYIIEKVKAGKITLTHFSDILRVTLLYEHGGLWMDATLYSADNIPERIFTQSFFSVRTPQVGDWVSRCLWTGFFMGGVKGHPLFGFVRDLFFSYWKEHDELLDYFLIDLGIMMAYDNIPQIKSSIDRGVWKTDKLFVPQSNIDKFIDVSEYNDILKEWQFFKMTYRDYFGKLIADKQNGQYTWYGYMLSH